LKKVLKIVWKNFLAIQRFHHLKTPVFAQH